MSGEAARDQMKETLRASPRIFSASRWRIFPLAVDFPFGGFSLGQNPDVFDSGSLLLKTGLQLHRRVLQWSLVAL